jgi:hypothetical protein
MNKPDRPWVANGPEDRLSIAVQRFLNRTLVRPCYFTAIHDRDGGLRTMQQRVRDKNRGIHKGQLDWDVVQGPPYLHRKLELKRGENDLTEAQKVTARDLTACGGAPVKAWELREAYAGLLGAGFRFTSNVETVLAHLEAELAGWDREAEAVLSREIVKPKRASKRRGNRPTEAQIARAIKRNAMGLP